MQQQGSGKQTNKTRSHNATTGEGKTNKQNTLTQCNNRGGENKQTKHAHTMQQQGRGKQTNKQTKTNEKKERKKAERSKPMGGHDETEIYPQ